MGSRRPHGCITTRLARRHCGELGRETARPCAQHCSCPTPPTMHNGVFRDRCTVVLESLMLFLVDELSHNRMKPDVQRKDLNAHRALRKGSSETVDRPVPALRDYSFSHAVGPADLFSHAHPPASVILSIYFTSSTRHEVHLSRLSIDRATAETSGHSRFERLVEEPRYIESS